MARSEQRQAKVTPEHLEEAKRLRALWAAKEGRPSQEKFGQDFDIGSQGAVWRFLNGRDPLSMKAAPPAALPPIIINVPAAPAAAQAPAPAASR